MSISRIFVWSATVVCLGLLARYLFGAPLPGWFALGALFALSATYLSGVLFPRLEMFGDVLFRAPPGEHGIVILLVGPLRVDLVPSVLQVLREHDASATFFLSAPEARRASPLTRQIIEAGHSLGLSLEGRGGSLLLSPARRLRRELEEVQSALRRNHGERLVALYPGDGACGPPLFLAAARCDLPLVLESRKVPATSGVVDGMILKLNLQEDNVAEQLRTCLGVARDHERQVAALPNWL